MNGNAGFEKKGETDSWLGGENKLNYGPSINIKNNVIINSIENISKNFNKNINILINNYVNRLNREFFKEFNSNIDCKRDRGN